MVQMVKARDGGNSIVGHCCCTYQIQETGGTSPVGDLDNGDKSSHQNSSIVDGHATHKQTSELGVDWQSCPYRNHRSHSTGVHGKGDSGRLQLWNQCQISLLHKEVSLNIWVDNLSGGMARVVIPNPIGTNFQAGQVGTPSCQHWDPKP